MTFTIIFAALLWLTGPAPQATAPVPLAFNEFFEPGAGELKPTAKLLALNGRRVRLAGFMARMETPTTGAFYLCPRPVYADESGGGNGDLPVNAVRVEALGLQGQSVAFVPHAFAVSGILEVGPHTAADGTVSALRLILDQPPAARVLRAVAPAATKPTRHLKPITKRRK